MNKIGIRNGGGTATRRRTMTRETSNIRRGALCPAGQSVPTLSMNHLSPAFLSSLSGVVVPRLRGLTGSPLQIHHQHPLPLPSPVTFLLLCASGNRSLDGQLGSGEGQMLDGPDFGLVVRVHRDAKIPTNASTTHVSSTVVINP